MGAEDCARVMATIRFQFANMVWRLWCGGGRGVGVCPCRAPAEQVLCDGIVEPEKAESVGDDG